MILAHQKQKISIAKSKGLPISSHWGYVRLICNKVVQETWTEGANWYSLNKLGGKSQKLKTLERKVQISTILIN